MPTSPLRVLVAPDKFKGSLTAGEAARHIAAGVRAVAPMCATDLLPVADGGEGTVEAALAAGFEPVDVTVPGPLGEPRTARYARSGGTVVVELAAADGLQHLHPTPATARAAGTRGVGRLVGHALDHGAETVVVGVGGSASTDGGAGLLAALGARLTARGGTDLPDGGAALADLVTADLGALHPGVARAQLVLASDVDNPLLGPRGAAAVYGPQKGADPAAVADLEAGLSALVDVLGRSVGPRARTVAGLPGAGAAGGAGYALLLVGAERRPGIDVVLDLAGFHDRVAGADLVLTGEGSLDEQSLAGKAPVGVAAAAAAHGVPTIALCGRAAPTPGLARRAGFRAVHVLTDVEPDVERCVREAGPLLETLAGRAVQAFLGSLPPASASSPAEPSETRV